MHKASWTKPLRGRIPRRWLSHTSTVGSQSMPPPSLLRRLYDRRCTIPPGSGSPASSGLGIDPTGTRSGGQTRAAASSQNRPLENTSHEVPVEFLECEPVPSLRNGRRRRVACVGDDGATDTNRLNLLAFRRFCPADPLFRRDRPKLIRRQLDTVQ